MTPNACRVCSAHEHTHHDETDVKHVQHHSRAREREEGGGGREGGGVCPTVHMVLSYRLITLQLNHCEHTKATHPSTG